MHHEPTSIVVLGSDTARGEQWLRDQLPSAARLARGLLMRCPGGELDAVVWAEELRGDARHAGVRLSIGVTGPTGEPLRDRVLAATRACDRARALGGDMTVARSALLRAA